jgi:hypothetical protein
MQKSGVHPRDEELAHVGHCLVMHICQISPVNFNIQKSLRTTIIVEPVE